MTNDGKTRQIQLQDVSLLEYRGVNSLNFIHSIFESLRRCCLLSQQRTSLYHQCRSRPKSQFKTKDFTFRRAQCSISASTITHLLFPSLFWIHGVYCSRVVSEFSISATIIIVQPKYAKMCSGKNYRRLHWFNFCPLKLLHRRKLTLYRKLHRALEALFSVAKRSLYYVFNQLRNVSFLKAVVLKHLFGIWCKFEIINANVSIIFCYQLHCWTFWSKHHCLWWVFCKIKLAL